MVYWNDDAAVIIRKNTALQEKHDTVNDIRTVLYTNVLHIWNAFHDKRAENKSVSWCNHSVTMLKLASSSLCES